MKKHILPGVAALLLTGVAHAREPDVPTPKPVQDLQILGAMSDDTSVVVKSRKQIASAANIFPQTKAHLEIQTVQFDRNMAPGSILVRTGERKLYLVLPDGQARMYPIGVGREGFTWNGTNTISRKAEWPDWRPPAVMIKREAAKGHFIPAFMPGGNDNPLGARALYIGSTQFRIHGTTQPWSIGRAVSSGCIRMLNAHVIDLYDQVKLGAKVVVE
jgi:lipoprotein-anchoring transpeptidase ErfK/SrfK